MARKEGSGFARATAEGVEHLAASAFVGDVSVGSVIDRLDAEHERGRCGVPGREIYSWLLDIAGQARLEVVESRTPGGPLGDVELLLEDGTTAYVEVKAQTTKGYSALLQADWVRDETDALRWLAANHPAVRQALSPWIIEELRVDNPRRQFGGLSFAELWLADVALLSDRARRAMANVSTMEDLLGFLERKYLLHVTAQGARLLCLADLPFVHPVALGEDVFVEVATGGKSDAIIWISVGSPPRKGALDFIYYVGYPNAFGRHKLHPSAVARASCVIVAPV